MSRYAVASGNWSNPAIWDGGILPSSTSVVRPNGFTVTINQNITVNELRNDASGPAVAGGSFVLTGNHTVNIAVSIQCFATSLLTYNGTGAAFITGTNTGAAIISSTTTNNTSTVVHSGTGHLTVDMVINSAIAGETLRLNIHVTGGGTLTCLKDVRKGGALTSYNASGTAAIRIDVTNDAVINVANVFGVGSDGYTIWSTVRSTINVNGNITALLLASAGTPNGGVILMSGTNTVLNITGNIIGPTSTGGGGVLRAVFLNAPGTINMTGTINNFLISGTNAANSLVFLNNSSAVLNLIGNVVGGNSAGATIVSGGSINITGSITAGSFGSSPAINTSGICTITGNVTGHGIAFSSNVVVAGGTCNITGTISGGSSNGSTGVNCSGGTLNHIGTVQASAFGSGIVGGLPQTSTVICTGPFLRNGFIVAFAGQTLRINSAYNPYFEFRKSNNTNVTYVDQSTLNFPATSDVRNGTTYASGLYTGTMNIPAPQFVRMGVGVDNTVGTAQLTAQDFITALSTSVQPLAVRLQNVSTVDTTGNQISSYNI